MSDDLAIRIRVSTEAGGAGGTVARAPKPSGDAGLIGEQEGARYNRGNRQGAYERLRASDTSGEGIGNQYFQKMQQNLIKKSVRGGAMFIGAMIAQEAGLGENFIGRLATNVAMGAAMGNWPGAAVAATMTVLEEVKNRVKDHEEKLKKLEEERIRAEVKRANERTEEQAQMLRDREEFNKKLEQFRRELAARFDSEIFASAQSLAIYRGL